MKVSPRVSQYKTEWTDAELDAALIRPPVAVELRGTDHVAQSQVLANAIKAIFLPDHQIRSVLRELISLARGHAEAHFDTDERYLKALYSRQYWGNSTRSAICLTGLAGAGKTEILGALHRLLVMGANFDVCGHRKLPLEAIWSMTLARGAGVNQILQEFVIPQPVQIADAEVDVEDAVRGRKEGKKDMKIPVLMELARRMSWRNGMCLATIDEFQRITASADANAKATSVLMQLLGIGPLLVFCANYSLVAKLKRRHQQERQRLLSLPIVVHPTDANDGSWAAYLAAVKSIAPEVFVFDPVRDAEVIHRYTFGLKRLVVDLVITAFSMSKARSSRGVVGSQELLSAYQSLKYSMNREEVEILHKQAITGTMIREDLWCPFISTETDNKVKTLSTAVEAFEARTEDALLASAMMPGEAEAIKVLAPQTVSVKSSGKLLRLRHGKASKDDLLAGAAVLDKLD